MNKPIVALVVENDETDFKLLKFLLRQHPSCELTWAVSKKEGLAKLDSSRFDIILLDLTLPDSEGTDIVREFVAQDSAPIVILTGLDNEDTALESVQLGAQDYLVKGSFDILLLVRTIRHAIERHKLRSELHASQQEVLRERELRRLQFDALHARLPTDKSSAEGKSLNDLHSEEFEQAVTEYSAILDHALERRAFKVEYNISSSLRALANALGVYRATPRDIVEIHTFAINSMLSKTAIEKNHVLNEEGRYILAGLLGHLCSFYRSNTFNVRGSPVLSEQSLESEGSR